MCAYVCTHVHTHMKMEQLDAAMKMEQLDVAIRSPTCMAEIIYRGIGNPPTHAYTLYAMHANRAI